MFFFILQINKPRLFTDLHKGFIGDLRGSLGVLLHDAFQVALIGQQTLVLLLDGAQGFCYALAHSKLEVAVALALKLPLDCFKAAARGAVIDFHEVGDTGLIFPVMAHFGIGIGDGALKLADNRVGIV